jgi:8-hydroxy-5-deazaflavin:NADPH oxidoreductase
MAAPGSIGVLGSGPVGRGLATLAARAGYRVVLGTGHPLAPALAEVGPAVEVGTFAEAARSDVVFLAVVHNASQALVTSLEAELADKTLVDADNAWLPGHREQAGLFGTLTEGRWMTRLVPRTRVVRAFSHIDWDLLVPRATAEPGRWAAAYTADGEAEAEQIEPVIVGMGYTPIRVGGLDEPAIDVGGVLWPGLLTPDQVRRTMGLEVA